MGMKVEHDPYNLEEGWDAVEYYCEDAFLAAFDGCHKIYLAMDEIEAQWFRENYDEYNVEKIGNGENLFKQVQEWFSESCFLKFVQAVWHNEDDPNDGFMSLIGQGAKSDDEEDEDYEW